MPLGSGRVAMFDGVALGELAGCVGLHGVGCHSSDSTWPIAEQAQRVGAASTATMRLRCALIRGLTVQIIRMVRTFSRQWSVPEVFEQREPIK